MASFETIQMDVRDGVARVTFNRPRRLNAFNEAMSHELVEAADRLREDEEVQVVVLRGSAGNFMGGADIGMLQEWSRLERGVLRDRLAAGFSPSLLEQLPQPVIAAVDGFALGMGCEVSLACDLRVATTRAEFGLPEITLGVIPGAGGSQRLPHLIGRTRAARVILTAERITAQEAADWGLVNAVVEPDELDASVDEIVESLRRLSPLALRRAKACLVASSDRTLYDGIDLELENFVDAVGTQDAAEGTSAFLEKRAPSFAGR